MNSILSLKSFKNQKGNFMILFCFSSHFYWKFFQLENSFFSWFNLDKKFGENKKTSLNQVFLLTQKHFCWLNISNNVLKSSNSNQVFKNFEIDEHRISGNKRNQIVFK